MTSKIRDSAGRRPIVVNGVETETEAANLSQLLAENGLADAKVATALNGEFVAAAARQGAALKPGDRVEIVVPRQGG